MFGWFGGRLRPSDLWLTGQSVILFVCAQPGLTGSHSVTYSTNGRAQALKVDDFELKP